MTQELPDVTPSPPTTSVVRSLVPLILAGAFMVVGILVLVYIGRDTARLMNAPLDDIDLRPLVDAKPLPSMAQMKGQVIVMHFWGTWCPPCKAELPEYAALVNSYQDQPKVKFLTVSCSPGIEENLDQLRDDTILFMHRSVLRISNYCDPAMFTRGKIAKMLSAGGFQYPMTLIVDKKGIVREYWLGTSPNTMTQVHNAIKSQLTAE